MIRDYPQETSYNNISDNLGTQKFFPSYISEGLRLDLSNYKVNTRFIVGRRVRRIFIGVVVSTLTVRSLRHGLEN